MAAITYKYLGDRDLNDAKVLMRGGSVSMAGRLAQQAVEKNLKQFIENNGDTDDMALLSIHSTVKLYDRVCALGGLVSNTDDRKMMAVLREYYYDINYPGEECRELTREEAQEAVDLAARLINEITW